MARRRRQGDPGRAVAYLRVSTDRQDISLEVQASDIEAWATREGVTIVETFSDQISGASDMEVRPGLTAALQALGDHRAGILVALRRDRIARDPYVTAQIEREAQSQGARVHTVDGFNGESPADHLIRGVLDNVAGFERRMIKARTSAALRTKQRTGKAAGGTPPYGWRKSGKLLEPIEEEQAAIRRALELEEGGAKTSEIARRLAEEGHPPRGATWHPRTVGRLLRRHRQGLAPA